MDIKIGKKKFEVFRCLRCEASINYLKKDIPTKEIPFKRWFQEEVDEEVNCCKTPFLLHD